MEQKLGRYTIEALLGEGSFARVYRAFDQKLKRYVALKVLKPMWFDDPSAMRRFEQEATTMANLHHSHIAEIYDVDESEGQVYLAQFLVEGETLAKRLTRGALSWAETLAILKGVAAALDYAHGQGIIHRDIKPANILLAQDGRPYLSDFGLVRAAEGSVAISSSSGGMVGTASYMAPEQWRGQAASPATDVYALSCVAVEMLTGKRLFDAPSSAAIMTKHVMDPPQFPAQWPPDVPEGVTAVLQRGLAKDPAERISRSGELVAELEALGITPQPEAVPVPEPAPAPPPPQPAPRRSSRGLGVVALLGGLARIATGGPLSSSRGLGVGVLLGGGLVLLIMVGVIIFLVIRPPATPEPQAPAEEPVAEEPAAEAPAAKEPAVEAPAELPQTVTAPDGATMVLVPAGPFEMGDDADVGLAECKKLYIKPDECERNWFEDEEPKHTVTLDDFYIDQYEVTNAQYAACVDDGACDLPSDTGSDTRDSYHGNSEYDDYPVIYVSWEQAKTYCEWREARLPTEAEWEKAARGIDGRGYPWGDTFDGTRTNFCDRNCTLDWANVDYDDGYADTAPVGSYSKGSSPYGAYDMAGNVWEWVADWYDGNYYSSSPAVNPTGPASGESRVVRGGAWYYHGFNVRAANRPRYSPSVSNCLVGFRCARSP